MSIPTHVFKAYDIRGLSPSEIDPDFAYRLGQAFVRYTGAKTVVVGRDMRATTPELTQKLIEGLRSQGAAVTDVGMVTTPMFYFSVANYPEYEAGIMVTASHNGAQYNGFKMVRTGAVPIGGDEIQEIRELVVQTPFSSTGAGSIDTRNIEDAYLDTILQLVDTEALKSSVAVIDGGNGMAGVILQKLWKRIGAKITPMYWEPDGTFPNHEANPIKEETLVDLKKEVINKKADLGVAYDGDGDRIGFVDENGVFIPSDLIEALLIPRLLEGKPGRAVLFDVRCSRVCEEEVLKAGGRPIMSRVGHAFIKKQLHEEQAVLAAELSGHFYLHDFFGVECSDLVCLLVMEIMAKTGKTLSELIKPLHRYAHSGEINFEVHDKEGKIQQLEAQYGKQGSITKIDGIRIDFPEWWFSVRASNTETLMRLNVEAKTEALMKEKVEEISVFLTE